MASRELTKENLIEVAEELCKDIEQTGGIVFDRDGNPVPAASKTWISMAEIYLKACMVLNRKVVIKRPKGETPMEPTGMEVGQAVQVYAMGCWYDGKVVKRGPKRATVEYTSGKGVTRQKAVPYAELAPAGTHEPMRKAPRP